MKTKIEFYVNRNGTTPFLEWIRWLSSHDRIRVNTFINRVASGGSRRNLKNLKDGVWEIKLSFGKGYRIYFGKDGDKLILLLLGGDKHTQKKDIKTAKEYWRDYGKQKR